MISVYGVVAAANFFYVRDQAVRRALSWSGTKGIINIGSGCDWSPSAMSFCKLPQVRVNLDVHVADNCPKCQETNLETGPLPFADAEFDVVLASHVLEHLNEWQNALAEWSRIADHVIVVLPHPLSISSYFNPLHRQHFSFADMESMRQGNIEVFC